MLHHLTGAAVAYANQWREWRRCTSDVGRVMKPFGTLVSKTCPHFDCNVNVYALTENWLNTPSAPFLLIIYAPGQLVYH